MKSKLLIALLSVLIGPFVAACLGQAGGFRELQITDKEVIASADFAIEAHGKKEKVSLVKILKAEVQVVAGRNFRISMDVRVDGGIRNAQVTVWAKLDKTRELTRWEWKGDIRPEAKGEPEAFPSSSLSSGNGCEPILNSQTSRFDPSGQPPSLHRSR
jgi:hypothetical protein